MRVGKEVLRRILEEVDFESLLHLMSEWGISVKGVKDREEALRRILSDGVTPVRVEDLLAVLDLERSLSFTFWRVYRFEYPKVLRAGTLERRLNRELSKSKGDEIGYFRVLNVGEGVIYVFYRFEREEIVGERDGVKVMRKVCHLKAVVGGELLLVEEGEWLERFLMVFSRALEVKVEEVLFPPFLLREFAERGIVRRAVVLLDEQITGAPGLSRVIVEGENVVKGAEKLRSRQELNFWSAGPLLEIETDRFVVSSNGRVKLKEKGGVTTLRKTLRLVEETLKMQDEMQKEN